MSKTRLPEYQTAAALPFDVAGGPARWYAVDKHGIATLCVDAEDAQATAAGADVAFPHNSPHRAAQLVPVYYPAPEIMDNNPVPEPLDYAHRDERYVNGWNDCRAQMIAAAQAQHVDDIDVADIGHPSGNAGELPPGWREQFKDALYERYCAMDNQDFPLEDYPAVALEVLESVVGPRHPTVVAWRNDAINACISIAYKYCRDPDSFEYLKQDLQALITAQAQPPVSREHKYVPHKKWPLQCAVCGYAEHEPLMHGELKNG